MLILLLTALTVTSGEDTHNTSVKGGALAKGRVCPFSFQVYLAVAVRKRGLVSLGQDTRHGKVRGTETLQQAHLSITDREDRE